jgi:PncC family amidohydrolase
MNRKSQELCTNVVARLRALKQNLALAESCTGGMACEWITEIAGVSDVFAGGVVVYSNEAKVELLGVPKHVFANEGAVSEACAFHLAKNVRERLKTDWAISITGIAGPGGGTNEKPVGMVCFGLASPTRVITQVQYFSPKSRRSVRESASFFALSWLLDSLTP